MKVHAIRTNQLTFKDDDTYFPPTYSCWDAFNSISEQGYIIEGKTTKDAFEKLHDDVNADLVRVVNSGKGVWREKLATGYRFNDRSVKYAVDKWEYPKEDFARLLGS